MAKRKKSFENIIGGRTEETDYGNSKYRTGFGRERRAGVRVALGITGGVRQPVIGENKDINAMSTSMGSKRGKLTKYSAKVTNRDTGTTTRVSGVVKGRKTREQIKKQMERIHNSANGGHGNLVARAANAANAAIAYKSLAYS